MLTTRRCRKSECSVALFLILIVVVLNRTRKWFHIVSIMITTSAFVSRHQHVGKCSDILTRFEALCKRHPRGRTKRAQTIITLSAYVGHSRPHRIALTICLRQIDPMIFDVLHKIRRRILAQQSSAIIRVNSKTRISVSVRCDTAADVSDVSGLFCSRGIRSH